MKSILKAGPAQRAAWAKELVQERIDGRDPRQTLNNWERDTFFAFDSVQLRIPLRDPVEVRQHVDFILGAFQQLALRLEQLPEGDRTDLLTVQSVVKALNQKLNAYQSRKRQSRYGSGT